MRNINRLHFLVKKRKDQAGIENVTTSSALVTQSDVSSVAQVNSSEGAFVCRYGVTPKRCSEALLIGY